MSKRHHLPPANNGGLPRRSRTVAADIHFEGTGVHSGEAVSVTIRPAEEGIFFLRSDVSSPAPVRVGPRTVSALPGRSIVGSGDNAVQTPEHILAALGGMGVDAAVIEVRGPEIPIMDGSALPFASAIADTGVRETERPAPELLLPIRLYVSDGGAHISAAPSTLLHMAYELHYEGYPPACGRDSFDITPEVFLREIAPARTFATEKEAQAMLSAGLGKGADETNTVLIGPNGPLKGGPFRFPNEPVRHKILDMIGDFTLLGARLRARVDARRSGHSLNHRLMEKIAMAAVLHPSGEAVRGEMDITRVQEVLPHRFPFLLVDRVIECDGEGRLVALKNVTRNEQFFEGHFPDRPLMPGVLQVEAMAQAAGILLMQYHPDPENYMVAMVGMDQVRFRRTVEPGDQLLITINKEKVTRRLGVVRATCTVNGELASEARLMFSVVPRRTPRNAEKED